MTSGVQRPNTPHSSMRVSESYDGFSSLADHYSSIATRQLHTSRVYYWMTFSEWIIFKPRLFGITRGGPIVPKASCLRTSQFSSTPKENTTNSTPYSRTILLRRTLIRFFKSAVEMPRTSQPTREMRMAILFFPASSAEFPSATFGRSPSSIPKPKSELDTQRKSRSFCLKESSSWSQIRATSFSIPSVVAEPHWLQRSCLGVRQSESTFQQTLALYPEGALTNQFGRILN